MIDMVIIKIAVADVVKVSVDAVEKCCKMIDCVSFSGYNITSRLACGDI